MRLPSALLFVVATALACGGKSESLDKPFFYSATKDGKTRYFLGTYHIGIDPKLLPSAVHDKIDAATWFITETDTSDAASLGFGQRKQGGTLREDLGPEYWAKLEKAFGGGMPPGMNQMHPAVVLLTLQLKDQPPHRMDEELKNKARQAGKQLGYLEPVAKQIRLIEKWYDVRVLKAFLDDPDTSSFKQMREIYFSGDEQRLIEFFHNDMAKMTKAGFTEAEIRQALEEFLYERNRSWITPIEGSHDGAFIAVGAAHLIGPNSVLDLLAKRGHTITRIAP